MCPNHRILPTSDTKRKSKQIITDSAYGTEQEAKELTFCGV